MAEDAAAGSATREAVAAALDELRRGLPPECRDVLGRDAEATAALVAGLAAAGREDLLARLGGEPRHEGPEAPRGPDRPEEAVPYRTMFSLDERTLAVGGESILRADGDLGRLLFSATAGMADLSRPLDALRVQSEAFFKPRGRTHAMAELKRRLADLKARRDAVDVLAPTYAGLAAARDAARAAFDAAAAVRTPARRARRGRPAVGRACTHQETSVPEQGACGHHWFRGMVFSRHAMNIGSR